MPEVEELNQEELVILEGMLSKYLITSRDEYRNTSEEILTLIAMKFIQDYDKIPFQLMEKWLRNHSNLHLYLIAIPVDKLVDGKEDQIMSRIPVGSNRNTVFPYYVRPIEGDISANKLLNMLYITPEANMDNLLQSGFPYPVQGTALSGEVNAINN